MNTSVFIFTKLCEKLLLVFHDTMRAIYHCLNIWIHPCFLFSQNCAKSYSLFFMTPCVLFIILWTYEYICVFIFTKLCEKLLLVFRDIMHAVYHSFNIAVFIAHRWCKPCKLQRFVWTVFWKKVLQRRLT